MQQGSIVFLEKSASVWHPLSVGECCSLLKLCPCNSCSRRFLVEKLFFVLPYLAVDVVGDISPTVKGTRIPLPWLHYHSSASLRFHCSGIYLLAMSKRLCASTEEGNF